MMSSDQYNNCPVCNYSAPPMQIKTVRKHFDGHALRCERCAYQTETRSLWIEAQRAWNKSTIRQTTLAVAPHNGGGTT